MLNQFIKLDPFERQYGPVFTAKTSDEKIKKALEDFFKLEGFLDPKYRKREKRAHLFKKIDAKKFADEMLKAAKSDESKKAELLNLLNKQDKRLEICVNYTKAQIT